MDAVAEVGCKYIGLMTHKRKTRCVLTAQSTLDDAAKVKEEAKQRGLAIPSIYFGGFDMTSRDKAVAELRHFIDLAAAAEAGSILLCGPDSPEQFDLYHSSVADCCDYALTKKVAVTIKPHGPPVGNSAELRNTVEKVGRKNFSVYYDPGNVFIYSRGKLNPLDDVSGVAGLVSGLIIKDYRSEPRGEGTVSLTPGTGEVDFPAVFAKLKKGGFTSGPLLVEPPIGGDYDQIVGEARKVRRLLEDLVR
jgi:sugar phosphate isomerase/epimerase